MPVPSGTVTLSSGNWTDIVQTAFDTEMAPYLREEPIFRPFTDKRPTRQAMPGDVVTLTIYGELALATTPLTENADVDAVAMPANRQLNVTLVEYGNAVVTSRYLERTAFTQTVAQDVGREVGLNAARSIDKIYQNVLDGATNVAWVDNTGDVVTADPAVEGNITSVSIQTMSTFLRRRNSVPRFGDIHACVIHPDVAHDLMAESGVNTWRQPHEQVDTMAIYNGVLGDYMGVRFVTNSKCTVTSATPDVYTTYFIDREALVEVVSDDVRVVVGPNIDKLNRFRTVGWYALLGVSRYRENALQLLKTASSIEAFGLAAFDGKA